jgi:hypothetical protein
MDLFSGNSSVETTGVDITDVNNFIRFNGCYELTCAGYDWMTEDRLQASRQGLYFSLYRHLHLHWGQSKLQADEYQRIYTEIKQPTTHLCLVLSLEIRDF